MGNGYTRNDVSNNIADGNIINASDLDGEFDAVESAFNSSTGHTHDGTAAEGGAITVVGPVQDLVVSATEVKPKTTNTLDLGTSALLYKDAYLQGNMYFRDTALKIVSSADGQLDIDADVEVEIVAPTVDIDASTALTVDTASTTFTSTVFNVTGSANITGDLDVDNINIDGNTIISTDTNGDINISPDGTGTVVINTDLDVDNININGNTIISTDTNGNIALTPNGTGEVDISKVDIASGEIDGTTIGANSAAAGTFTTLSATTLGSAVDLNSQALTNANIDSGAIDGITLGTNSAVTEAQVDNININGNTISSTDTNGNITLAPDGTGVVDVTGTVTADGLTVEGTTGITISGAFPLINFGETDTTDENSRVRVSAGDFRIDTVDNSYANGKTRFLLDNATGDISFYDSTGTTQGLFWDASAESLGIGTTSPARALHVNSGIGNNVALFQSSDATAVVWLADGNSTSTAKVGIGAVTDDLLLYAGGSQRLRIDDIGNVGIGTTIVDSLLHLQKQDGTAYSATATDGQVGVGPTIYLENPSNTNASVGGQIVFGMRSTENQARIGATGGTAPALVFGTNDAERLRIDSSGNLLVGTTTTDTTAGSGFTVQSDGQIFASAESQHVATLTRLTDDGDIITFRRSAVGGGGLTTAGSIGVDYGDRLYIGTGGTGLFFNDVSNDIQPISTTAGLLDDTIDLGSSSSRFRDLVLSGGVFLGGTGSANKLDDYEEGTFTVEIADLASGGNVSAGTGAGTYTKIGNICYYTISEFNLNTTGLTGTNVLYFRNFPFIEGKGQNHQATVWYDRVNLSAGSNGLVFAISASDDAGLFYELYDNAGESTLKVNQINDDSTDFYITGFYMTA